MKHSALTAKIIQAFYDVYNTLGYGFLEKVYENALYYKLKNLNLKCKRQSTIKVYYENNVVGEFYADIIVGNKVILELKAAEQISVEHEYQLINYLRATDMEVGLLLNFGRNPEFKRKIYSNNPIP